MPTVFSRELRDSLLAGERVARTLSALVDVLGRRIAHDKADIPALRHQQLQLLAELDAQFIIVGADVGLPERGRPSATNRHLR